MSGISTSHFAIFDYWKDKHLSDLVDPLLIEHNDLVVNYWDDPCCWACGKLVFRDKLQLEKYINEETEDYRGLWSDKKVASKLNRCHIVPAMLGGGDKPSNLFLLCERCHVESPDTSNPANFYRWVAKRRNEYINGDLRAEIMFKEIEASLQERGLRGIEQVVNDVAMRGGRMEGLSEYLQKHVGIHAGHVSHSSIIAGVTDWMLDGWITTLLND